MGMYKYNTIELIITSTKTCNNDYTMITNTPSLVQMYVK